MSGFLTVIMSMAAKATTGATTETTTERSNILEALDTGEKASELSNDIINIIYILVAAVIVIAVITLGLYVYKFFKNRKDPNYVKNDDEFLDD